MAGEPRVLVVMGVSGSGKTTVATKLAARLGWAFEEGDSLHPESNVAKMAAGVPLTDEDRWPCLHRVADWVNGCLDRGQSGVITCSALKRSYRDLIDARGSGITFVYLRVSRDELEDRVEHRAGHFMPASLLDSQLATLEEPGDDEPVIRVNADRDADAVVSQVVALLA